jgi:hypothetical protein
LATAVADHGGAETVTLNRPELLGNLLDLGWAIEAGDGVRALDLLAALIGRERAGWFVKRSSLFITHLLNGKYDCTKTYG